MFTKLLYCMLIKNDAVHCGIVSRKVTHFSISEISSFTPNQYFILVFANCPLWRHILFKDKIPLELADAVLQVAAPHFGGRT